MVSKSPQRHTFQKEGFIERSAENGKTPENDEETRKMVEWYKNWKTIDTEREADLEWQKNNLEWDLRNTNWILEKARTRDSYAQNIYAALCNNDFTKLDVLPILKEQKWSCSWRYAGGVVADMRQEGDYIDWYCSGIGGQNLAFDGTMTKEEWGSKTGYVPEGRITEEIRADLQKLGWIPAPGGDWERFERDN
jgi:hypothetical protein